MNRLLNKTAVITGGGNGLGRALAFSCAERGMNVVLADIDANALAETAARACNRAFASVRVELKVVDISDLAQVEALAQFAQERFGSIYAVFNNAGVGAVAPIWENTEQDWQWLINVNILGVAWGVKAFTPYLIEAGEGHIINTASAAAWFHQAGSGIYNTTKAAVLALSETLANDLIGTGVNVSVLSPAYFPAGITDSDRVRPKELMNDTVDSAAKKQHEEKIREAIAASKISAQEIAELTLSAVEVPRFYVFPHTYVPDLFFMRAKAAKAGTVAFDPNAFARPKVSA